MNLLRLPLIRATQAYDVATFIFNSGPALFYPWESRLHALADLAADAAEALLHLLNCNDAADDLWERATTSTDAAEQLAEAEAEEEVSARRRRPCFSSKKPAPRIRPGTGQTQGKGTVSGEH